MGLPAYNVLASWTATYWSSHVLSTLTVTLNGNPSCKLPSLDFFQELLIPKVATIIAWDYIGIMKNIMETTIISWYYIMIIIGIMENIMETTLIYWYYP